MGSGLVEHRDARLESGCQLTHSDERTLELVPYGGDWLDGSPVWLAVGTGQGPVR